MAAGAYIELCTPLMSAYTAFQPSLLTLCENEVLGDVDLNEHRLALTGAKIDRKGEGVYRMKVDAVRITGDRSLGYHILIRGLKLRKFSPQRRLRRVGVAQR